MDVRGPIASGTLVYLGVDGRYLAVDGLTSDIQRALRFTIEGVDSVVFTGPVNLNYGTGDNLTLSPSYPASFVLISSYQPWKKFVSALGGVKYKFLIRQETYLKMKDAIFEAYIIPDTLYEIGSCNLTPSPQGWTTLDECRDGIPYLYCTTGYSCSPACKGPCSENPLNLCIPVQDGFTCYSPIVKKPWYTSLWIFFILVIFVIVIVVIFSFTIN